MNNKEFEDIEEYYEYDYEQYKTTVRYFPDDNLATVTKVSEDLTEVEVLKKGMILEEFREYFPPLPPQAKQGATFNLAKIIRSIMYEAFMKEGVELEEGNVRNFWYTHLKKVITEILGLGETDSVRTALNTAWDEMINSGLINYENMNIFGGKESSRISIVKDSPFSNLIIGIEKLDYFNYCSWIPKLFNCTLITAGGQPSRTVARAFIKQLRDLGVDLDQTFYLCTISDLDPAGYYIQDAFRKQFESAIKYYGGEGKVEIERLFVRKDQVSRELLISEAIPCRDKAKKEKAKKAEETKWNYFCRQTDGGLYIPEPPGWIGAVYDVDGVPSVRALLEMNAFGKGIVESSIIKELLRIIEDTSDESKIMIPEIMRVFELMRGDAIEDVYNDWYEKLIKPLIDKFLIDTEKWDSDISYRFRKEINVAKEHRDEQLEPIDEKFNELVEEQENNARERVPDLYEKKEGIEAKIATLEQELEETDDNIHDECSDIFEKIDELEADREEEKQPITDEYDEEYKDIDIRNDYRKNKLQEFRDEHSTVFNPLEMLLKTDISQEMSINNILYFFKDIEQMTRFQVHIVKLLVSPGLLVDDGLSCFEHPVATFSEEDLLTKASEMKDENIERVRNAFPPAFTEEMKKFIKEHVVDKEFELKGEVEEVDLTDEIEQAMKQTEEEIDKGLWKEPQESEDKDEEGEDNE